MGEAAASMLPSAARTLSSHVPMVRVPPSAMCRTICAHPGAVRQAVKHHAYAHGRKAHLCNGNAGGRVCRGLGHGKLHGLPGLRHGEGKAPSALLLPFRLRIGGLAAAARIPAVAV